MQFIQEKTAAIKRTGSAVVVKERQRLCGNLQVDIRKARELLGWVPKRTSVVEWIRNEMV